ncbi:MAG: hypothetical protein IV097_00450 [Burkholderiaceae bacterium]|nr:hypothetical protein [Burkholderiaceae bacterium]
MLWWIFVLTLFYASARWTGVNVAVRSFFFVVGIVGLLMMLQTGYIPVFLGTIVEIPMLLLKGVLGVIKAVLFP